LARPPLELVGAPVAVSPEDGWAVVAPVPPPTVPVVEAAPDPEVVDPEAGVVVVPSVVDVVPEVLVGLAGVVEVVDEEADTAGLDEPECTATPTTPVTNTAAMAPPRASMGATGTGLPLLATPNF
jgi:hypothetical protein